MSSDPSAAYQEGRQEAQAASAAATSMGLTNYGMGGTIIYYDMEVIWWSQLRMPPDGQIIHEWLGGTSA